jgi:trimeric autotransporter adhesin
MLNKMFRSSACVLLIMTFGASLVEAQMRSASIAGTVLDAAGGVVPNADVVVTEQSTNVSTPTKSTAAGEFTVPYLPAGTYSVSVNVAGFQPFVAKDLALATTQTIRVTANLSLSGVQQSVEVAAAAAQIQTDSSSVSGAVQAHTIETIPNITQNPLFYAMLQANVSPTNATADTQSVNSFGIGINGRRQFSAFETFPMRNVPVLQ